MSDTPITDMFKAFMHGVDGDKYWVPLDCAKGLERSAKKARIQRDEARSLLEAAYAKCDRAEKMLRTAAAKVDAQAERIRQLEGATNHAGGTPLSQWRECAEGLARLLRQRIDYDDDVFLDWEADQLAVFDRLKKEGK
jgi:hypothetical protein